MKVFRFAKDFVKTTANGVLRFPAVFLNVAVLWLVSFCMIVFEIDDEPIFYFTLSLVCSSIITTALYLFAEFKGKSGDKIWKNCIFGLDIIIVATLYALFFHIDIEFYAYALVGVSFAALIFGIYLLTDLTRKLGASAHFLKNLAFSMFVSTVVLLGGLLCIGAFIMLIYDFNDSYKLFLILLDSTAILSVLIFLSSLTKPKEELEQPKKIYKAVLVYAELIIYFVLTAVLYLYLFKTLFITTELPSGAVNPYVTAASVAFILNIFAVGCFKDTSRLAGFFMKYGGILMLPLIAMQCYALGIRLYHYGLTTARMLSVCFIAVTLAFALGTFVKRIGLGKPLILAAIISLIITVTPFNIINVPVWQQSYSLKSLLYENGMIAENGEIIKNSELDTETKEKILDIHLYLRQNCDDAPAFLKNREDWRNGYELFGFDIHTVIEETQKQEYCSYHNTYTEVFDISEYSGMAYVESYADENMYIYPAGDSGAYSIEKIAEFLIAKLGTGYNESDEQMIIAIDDTAELLYDVVRFDYNYDTGKITDVFVKGFILIK